MQDCSMACPACLNATTTANRQYRHHHTVGNSIIPRQVDVAHVPLPLSSQVSWRWSSLIFARQHDLTDKEAITRQCQTTAHQHHLRHQHPGAMRDTTATSASGPSTGETSCHATCKSTAANARRQRPSGGRAWRPRSDATASTQAATHASAIFANASGWSLQPPPMPPASSCLTTMPSYTPRCRCQMRCPVRL